MNISIKPAGLLVGAIAVGISITVSVGCSGGGPLQVSDQNRERCYQHNCCAAYTENASDAAALVERLAADGKDIAAGEAAEYARQMAEEAEADIDRIDDL